MEVHKRDTPSLPDNCGYHRKAGGVPSQNTNSQHSKRQGLCLSTCEKWTINIPASFSVKFLCFVWIPWNFLCWHVYSKSWSFSFQLWNVFFTCVINGLALGWTQSGMDSWTGLWNEVFQTGFRHISFITCMKILEVVGSLVTLGHTLIKNQAWTIDF